MNIIKSSAKMPLGTPAWRTGHVLTLLFQTCIILLFIFYFC